MSISTLHEFAVNVLKEIGTLSVAILEWLNSPLPEVISAALGIELLWYQFLFGSALLSLLIIKLGTIVIEWFSPVS